MITHTFPHTPTQALIDAETALADVLDPLSEIVAAGDLPGGLYAELAQIKAQLAQAVERRPKAVALNGHGKQVKR